MENKINIAEILKNCPKGMELDCTMWDSEAKVFFKEVLNDDFSYPIVVTVKYNNREYTISFNKYGTFNDFPYSKCIIFPKGKTTWEGYHRPFKDGDVVATNNGAWIGIAKGSENGSLIPTYCAIKSNGAFEAYLYIQNEWMFSRLATEEEKQKLFDAIKANGYKWNEENKTLEKFVVPKFKVGDRIKQKGSPRSYIISSIEYDRYRLNNNQFIRFTDEHIYELVPNKFDITTLKPFDKVLVRCNTLEKWRIQLFEKYDKTYQHPFICIGCNKYKQCIPYEGNEHLLDTTDDCDEYFKSWKMD